MTINAEFWSDQIHMRLADRTAADAMLNRSHPLGDLRVVVIAAGAINNYLAVALHAAGGMSSPW